MTLGDGLDAGGAIAILIALERLTRVVSDGFAGVRADFRAYVAGERLQSLPATRRRARRVSASESRPDRQGRPAAAPAKR